MRRCSREWEKRKKLIAAKIGGERVNGKCWEVVQWNGKAAASDINVGAGRADDGASL